MMLIVTPEDFRQLSPICRQELVTLLSSRGAQVSSNEVPEFHGEDEGSTVGGYQEQSDSPTIDDVLEEKRIVDVTVEQARELIANINPESQQTLRMFASGAPVALVELIGEGGPYRDFNHLKRSCVGAVNRRLRTVLGNRLAVLFSSDREKTRIKITSVTAASLRQVLDIPEPLPHFEYIDAASGEWAPEESIAVRKLQDRLQLVWRDFHGRPEIGSAMVGYAKVVKHFIDHGFEATTGTMAAWKKGSDSPVFDLDSKEASAQLRARLEAPFQQGDDVDVVDVFLSHEEVPGVLAHSDSVILSRPR